MHRSLEHYWGSAKSTRCGFLTVSLLTCGPSLQIVNVYTKEVVEGCAF